MQHTHDAPCELCDNDGGTMIFRADDWRVVRVDGAEGEAYPGFCRVVWNTHVKELTDLLPAERQSFMNAVFAVEGALRNSLAPTKMNIASLGNLTPHLHWHVIPRFTNDAAFPKPIWAVNLDAPPQRVTLASDQGNKVAGESSGTWQHEVRCALESL